MTVLSNMSDILNKFANVLSDVLIVDVSIVDIQMTRIAGTGVFESSVGNNIDDEGNILKSVIETGQKFIIENPRENEICLGCVKMADCKETFEMSTPIILDDEIIGGIGFVSFSKTQRDHLLENYDALVKFLDHTSEFIATKAAMTIEHKNNSDYLGILTHVIDKVDEGVMVINNQGELLCYNNMASSILGNSFNTAYQYTIEIRPLNHELLDYDEYEIKISDKIFNVAGKLYDSSGLLSSKTLIFKDIQTVKESILSSLTESDSMNNIIGESREMISLKQKIGLIAPSSSTVLITGESGTGKEMFAGVIHKESSRKSAPFIPINCGAIPEHLFESELFGYVRGAFTGADPKGKIGKFELADGGTIFLDEIGDMPIHVQVKILRVLENRTITKLGSNTEVSIDVRVIAATNHRLEELIEQGQFREDLFYRLNVIPLELPPLRNRIDDLPKLTDYFINKYANIFSKNIKGIQPSYYRAIQSYEWPGNIRELQNAIEYSINLLKSPYLLEDTHLPPRVFSDTGHKSRSSYNLEALEKEMILSCFEEYGHLADAKNIIASKLGIGIATLYRKLKKYDIHLSK